MRSEHVLTTMSNICSHKQMQNGVPMLMVSAKSARDRDATGQINGSLDMLTFEAKGSKPLCIALSSIKELRHGAQSAGLKARCDTLPAAQCMTIIYGDAYKVCICACVGMLFLC